VIDLTTILHNDTIYGSSLVNIWQCGFVGLWP